MWELTSTDLPSTATATESLPLFKSYDSSFNSLYPLADLPFVFKDAEGNINEVPTPKNPNGSGSDLDEYGYLFRYLLPSEDCEIVDVGQFKDIYSPLNFTKDITYYRVGKYLYLFSSSNSLGSLIVKLRISRLITQNLGTKALYVDLESENPDSIYKSRIKQIDFTEGTSGNFTYNYLRKIITFKTDPTSGITENDIVDIFCNYSLNSLEPYLKYYLFDLSNIDADSIEQLTYKSITFKKTFDKVNLKQNTLFYNRYTRLLIALFS